MGTLGAVLAAYKRRLGRFPGRHGAVLEALRAMLEPYGSQQAPKLERKRAPNRALEATRAENGEITKLAHITHDFNYLSGLPAFSLH